jgi:hypothetical protein
LAAYGVSKNLVFGELVGIPVKVNIESGTTVGAHRRQAEETRAGIWGREKGGKPLYPLFIAVEHRLIWHSQDLTLHAVLSAEVSCYRLFTPISFIKPALGCWHR